MAFSLGGGKSKSKQNAQSTSQSGNLNNNLLTGAYGGENGVGLTGKAGGLLSSLLGGDTGALDSFANSGGMKWMQDQGMKGIESNKAAAGLLNSGSYGTALADYNHGLTSTYLNQYMDQVNNMGKLGLGAGGILADSGKYETSQSTSSGRSKSKNGSIGVGK